MSKKTSKKTNPGSNPEAREKKLIAYAMDLAEKQLVEGSASPSIVTHFLKLGASNADLEREKLKHESLLLQAKVEDIKSKETDRQLHEEAIEAMKRYAGND